MSRQTDFSVTRRDAICGGGASVLAALLGNTKRARAEALSGPVPEIDALAVRVVIDNNQFAVAPSKTEEGLAIEHFGWGISPDHPPRHTLVSEFGLAMHIESHRGAQTRNILMDFGYTPEALINNTELSGLAPSRLDALVLSHGHYDHFGGLVGFLQKYSAQLKPKLPFFVGGEDCFCSREWTGPPVHGDFGTLDRRALKNLSVTYAEGPSLIADHGFTPGQIGLQSFEKLLSPTVMKVGTGCDASKLPENERTRSRVPDQFRHEISTVFNLKGKGLILLTSCSHRGVVNAIKQAQAASGVDKVHALIGGFHLAPYPQEYVQQTVAALKDLNIDHLIPLHCTGELFYEMAKAQMPGTVRRSYTGTRFVFS